jgi:membrane-associated phospholipid phosphatase
MRRVSAIAGFLLICTGLFAQEQPVDPTSSAAPRGSASSRYDPERCGLKKLDRCFRDLVHDQAAIWTSPLRVKPHDAIWLVPFAGATGAAFAFDEDALRQVSVTNKSLIDKSAIVSRFGSAYATFGEAGVLYLVGSLAHNDHLRETGVLGAEAVVNASLVFGALKLATNRERPDQGSGTGGFWPHGPSDYSVASSFPSGHATASWALARVISAEYPGWPTKLCAYGFATAISASRITARRHFPSDVVVGSTLGYLIGGLVVRHHSSVDQREMSFSVLPLVDDTQRTYGITLTFEPSNKQMKKMGHAARKLARIFGVNRNPPASETSVFGGAK